MDISNGENIGVSLFVQGCHFHCYNCFNPETWDFSGGKEWTQETKEKFLELVDRPYIKRISILGGEPLAEENLDGVLDLVIEINKRYNVSHISLPRRKIWLYTGFLWDDVFDSWDDVFNDNTMSEKKYNLDFIKKALHDHDKRKQIISKCDVLVDGRYIESKHDITLHWKGSSNQRVIDVKKTLFQNKIVLYE